LAPSGSGSLGPTSRSASSHEGSQSPSRAAKVRRSWLPGGGRSRSNSEVSNVVKSEAWVMADETQAEYNSSLLRNGEKVTQTQPGLVFCRIPEAF
jgi:hypothetical protein